MLGRSRTKGRKGRKSAIFLEQQPLTRVALRLHLSIYLRMNYDTSTYQPYRNDTTLLQNHIPPLSQHERREHVLI